MAGKRRTQSTALVICVAAAWTAVAATSRPLAVAARPPQTEPSQTAESAAPPEAFRRVCVRCHTSDRVVEGRRFRAQWEELVEQMVARGAMGSDEDFEIVMHYLLTEYGRVNVNTATAAELAQVLHLDASAADAIAQYRREVGRFVDFQALLAVPGLSVDALRTRRDAIFFQP